MSVQELPSFFNFQWVDKNDLTPQARFYEERLNQALASIFSQFNDGLQMPIKTAAEITTLEPDAPNGTVWFNSDIAKLQVKVANGTIETITSA